MRIKKNRLWLFPIVLLLTATCSKEIVSTKVSYDAAKETATNFRVVGYLNNWENFPASIYGVDLVKLTHINIAFTEPLSSGKIKSFSGLETVVEKAHAANVKVLISLGGADLGNSKKFWKNLTTPDNVKSFCNKICNYVQANDLDGVDIDLEGNIIGDNYANFIQTLSSKLKPNSKLLTAAVATWFARQIPASAFAYFDFVNIMSYDKTGPWDPHHPGPSSPYRMAVDDINFWSNKGLPQNKMGLGVPFYGWGFYNAFSQNEYAFEDLIDKYPGAENTDKIGDTIYYNGIQTIKNKTKLALQKASGIMIWQITEDAGGSQSLLSAINLTINNY